MRDEPPYIFVTLSGGITPYSEIIVGEEPHCIFVTLLEEGGAHPIPKS